MSISSIAMPSARPATSTPTWAVLAMGIIGAAFASAVLAGGRWPFTVAVLMLLVLAFILVVQRPHLGISVFLTTFLINYPDVARGTGLLTINNLLGGVFLLLLAWHYYRDRDLSFLRQPLIRLLLAIGAVFIVGSVAAEYTLPDQYIQRLVVRPAGFNFRTDFTERFMFQFFSRVGFVIFIVRFVETPKQLRGIFLALLACILVAVPPALSGLASGETGGRALTRLVNWADNANRFAFGMVLGASLLYHFAATARDIRMKVLAGLVGALLIPISLLSASRSGFVGLFLLAFLVLIGTFGGRRRRGKGGQLAMISLMAAIGGLTYLFVLPPAMQERLLNLNPFSSAESEGSTSTDLRTATLQNSIEVIKDHPVFGVGLGNFRWYHKLKQGRFKPPHNSYVWALAEGGVPLLLVYLGFFATVWFQLGRLREAYLDHPDLPCFPNWLRVYLILLLYFSCFADVWLEEHIFLLAGATMLLQHWRPDASQETAAPALATATA